MIPIDRASYCGVLQQRSPGLRTQGLVAERRFNGQCVLALTVGDVVEVTSDVGGWWTGAISGTVEQGRFPSNYVSKEDALYADFQVTARSHLFLFWDGCWGWRGQRIPYRCDRRVLL